MAMTKACEVCRTGFVAQRASARYCSGKCRAKASRQPKPATRPQLSAVPALTVEQRAALGCLEESTRRELEAAGRADTVYGQLALILARRIDGPSTDTGSSIAALAKVWRDATATALEGANKELDPLQVIRARMAERGHRFPGMGA